MVVWLVVVTEKLSGGSGVSARGVDSEEHSFHL